MDSNVTPTIGLGEPCLWRHSPGGTPAAAIVTRVGRSAISVVVFPPDSPRGIVKDGVRHVEDPALREMPDNDGGCWDYTDSRKAVAEFLDA